MFVLHASNKTENLLIHLTKVLETSPLTSPFSREIFLIQSQGMERWLSQQLAGYFAVWGNYEFLFPGKFFSQLAQQIDSRINDEDFSRECLLWKLESLLRDTEVEQLAPLHHYSGGAGSALKRFQLARCVAQLFDQYQIMRHDMLVDWQRNTDQAATDSANWQRYLWRQLIAKFGNQHRGALWSQAITKLLEAAAGDFTGKLPERVLVFGLNTMPPLFLAFLQALSRHVQVHLFLLNPCRTYWADVESQRRLARQKNHQHQQSSLDGHPLLATLGQQGREFQEMLLERADFELQLDSFEAEENARPSNLQQLQNDILNNHLSTLTLLHDGSISMHSCHSRMREVQVLKYQLLQTLETERQLELRDIVVMAPDIQLYSPFITAVFDDVPHAIADRSMRLDNPLLDAFIAFLRLSQSRFGWQEVLDLLEQPAVYSSFGLSETDLELITQWIADTQIRWGKSAEHKAQLGLPGVMQNTWQAGLERLLIGYACGSDEHFVHGVLPYAEIEGSSAQALGGLYDFIMLLGAAGKEFSRAKTLRSWGEQLYAYADRLFSDSKIDASRRRQLNELFAELSDKLALIHDDLVELDVIIAWLEDAIQEQKSSTGFLRGQLTFCSMLPMRSIPFQVIALLGMNEGEFPKHDNPATFDLIAQNLHKGDRSRRADDRYQFLEILLSARKQLIITYIGQSINHNELIQPSVVISEVLEILKQSYQLSDLIVVHPLQAFSPRNFSGESRLYSFSDTDCRTAQALQQTEAQPAAWWQGEIGEATQPIIDLEALFAFFRHPQRYFMQRILSVYLHNIETLREEREPFAVSGLDAYQINQDWIAAQLQGRRLSMTQFQAQGLWLSGNCGAVEFKRREQQIAAFVDVIEAKNLGRHLVDAPLDMTLDQYRLVGQLSNRYENGGLFFRLANLKGKDFLLAWLHHLIINQQQAQATHLLSSDEDLIFTPEMAQGDGLIPWLELFITGQSRPDVFFVEPALAYVRQAFKLETGGKAKKPAVDVAADVLRKAIDQGYDAELNRLYGNFQDLGILIDQAFERHCLDFMLPVWKDSHGY